MKLTKEERELSGSVERGEWKSVDNVDVEIARAREIARATAAKDERMNIRMSRRDMLALKARALELGIPYQTLVSTVLRQWLRRSSTLEQRLIPLGALFSELEVKELAEFFKRRLSRPKSRGLLSVRDASGVYRPRQVTPDRLLEQLTAGDEATLASLELSQADLHQLFERIFRLQGSADLTAQERALIKTVLDRISRLTAPIRL